MYCSRYFRFISVMLAGSAGALMTGCQDSPFYDRTASDSPYPVFRVDVSSSWTAGTRVTRGADTEILINRVAESVTDDDLYLVAEVTDLNSGNLETVQKPETRGTRITGLEKYGEAYGRSFGLYAVCYTDKEEKTDWSDITDPVKPNVANNAKIAWGTDGVASATDLSWPGSGRVRFMGYAPYSDGGEDGNYGVKPSSETESPTISFVVNNEVKSQVDLLTAVADCNGAGGQQVNLNFGHALSAISFKTGDAMLAGTVTKIEVAGVKGAGSLNMLTGKWTTSGDDKTYTISLEKSLGNKNDADNDPYTGGGQLIAGGETEDKKDDTLTMFMIPQQLTSDARISMTFTDNTTKEEWTLTAPIGTASNGDGASTPKTWEAGKLYTYSISTTGIVITPVVEIQGIKKVEADDNGETREYHVPYTGVLRNLSLSAYLKIDQADKKTVYVADKYKLEYALADGGFTEFTGDGLVWEDATAMTVAETDETTVPQPRAIKMIKFPAQNVFETAMKLQATSEQGTEDNPYDLTDGGETANCYMINEGRYGWFRFPLYYGNSRGKGGADNVSAYTLNDRDPIHDKGMTFFVDHNNKEIKHGNIVEQQEQYWGSFIDLPDTKAELLWQDSPGLVDKVKLEKNGTQSYIKFYVDKHTLARGNAVIALLDGVSEHKGDVVWSWHIWVTDQKWNGNTVEFKSSRENESDGITYSFVPSTLGYCDRHVGEAKRTIRLRVKFDMFNALGENIVADKFVFKENGSYTYSENGSAVSLTQDGIEASIAGDNTYYQWGRKDPMLGGVYDAKETIYYPFNVAANNGNDFTHKGEFTMRNKRIFDCLPGTDSSGHLYVFGPSVPTNGLNLGEAITHPQWFVMGEDKEVDGLNYRSHWHNYTKTDSHNERSEYMEAGGSMYNTWNSSASKPGIEGNTKKEKKTIYDPSPAGYHIPPAIAFKGMVNAGAYYADNRYDKENDLPWDEDKRCWSVSNGSGRSVKLYAVGLRDMNLRKGYIAGLDGRLKGKTWASFSMLTYIVSCNLNTEKQNRQTLIFYLDRRGRNGLDSNPEGKESDTDLNCGCCASSNNSYGMSVWPVADD